MHPAFDSADFRKQALRMAFPLRENSVAKAKQQRDTDRAHEIAKFLTICTDSNVPPEHAELQQLAKDIVAELNDLDARWREELWGRG